MSKYLTINYKLPIIFHIFTKYENNKLFKQ